MSRKEIKEAIHSAKIDSNALAKPTFLDGIDVSKRRAKNKSINFYYDKMGKMVQDPEKGFAYRTEYMDGKQLYYIKFAIAGSGIGRMLNLNGMYYREGDENKYEKDLARKTYEFKPVNQRTFDLYIKFLQSKNEKYILEAERESIHGQN